MMHARVTQVKLRLFFIRLLVPSTYTKFKCEEIIFSFEAWIFKDRGVANCCGALLAKTVFNQIYFFQEVTNYLISN